MAKNTFFVTFETLAFLFVLILGQVRPQDRPTITRIDESTTISDKKSSLNEYYRCLPELRVKVIGRCPAGYADKGVIRQCEKGMFPLDDEDVTVIMPATSGQSGHHYANRYCARCHGEPSAEPWELNIGWPGVDRPIFGRDGKLRTNEDVLSTLRYDPTLKRYTVQVTAGGRPSSCTFEPIAPDNVAAPLAGCVPPVIWECPSAYDLGAEYCKRFPESLVYDSTVYVFGNAECVRCNNFTLASPEQGEIPVLKFDPVRTLFKLRKPSSGDACAVPAIAKYYCSGR